MTSSPWTIRNGILAPVRYWQFKNGKTAPLFGDEWRATPHYVAFDRGLGCEVVYAR